MCVVKTRKIIMFPLKDSWNCIKFHKTCSPYRIDNLPFYDDRGNVYPLYITKTLWYNLRLFSTSDWTCQHCGHQATELGLFPIVSELRGKVYSANAFVWTKKGDLTPLTKDHIIPKFHGGPNAKSNLQTLCYNCNQIKGSNLPNPEELLAFGLSSRTCCA